VASIKSCKFLFICGANDQIVPMDNVKEIISWISDPSLVRVEVVSSAGHQVMEEQPESVNGLLIDFIRSCSSAGSLSPPTQTLSSM